MDFSNVNQSEKQAEAEMVWKMQVPHTHAHGLPVSIQLWGSRSGKLHLHPITAAVRGGKQSQIVTQIFPYQLSLV